MTTNVLSTDGTVRWRRAPQSMRCVLGLIISAAANVLAPSAARAQDSLPPSEPPTLPVAAAVPPGAYVCTVTDRGELNDVDAVTAADVVCGELKKQGAPGGAYTVRFGHLGSRTRLVVASGTDQREAWFSSMDEVEVAAARLVEALVSHRTPGDAPDTPPERRRRDGRTEREIGVTALSAGYLMGSFILIGPALSTKHSEPVQNPGEKALGLIPVAGPMMWWSSARARGRGGLDFDTAFHYVLGLPYAVAATGAQAIGAGLLTYGILESNEAVTSSAAPPVAKLSIAPTPGGLSLQGTF